MTTQTCAVSAIVAEIQGLCNEVGVDEAIRTGPQATYQNSLIVTILILKSLFGFDSESSFLRFLSLHYQHVFPKLPEQSWFNRKAKKLVSVEERIHEHLMDRLAVDGCTIEVVDTTPVPVVKLHRAYACKSFKRKAEVAFGYCASKKTYYYGKKLSLFVTAVGIPTFHGLTVANKHDLTALKELLPRRGSTLRKKQLIADKGYYDGELRIELKKRFGARLVVPDKKRHHRWNTKTDKRLLRRRSIIETVNEQLQDHMKIHHTRAKSEAGLTARVQAIILAFAFGCYYNVVHGRPILALKSILV